MGILNNQGSRGDDSFSNNSFDDLTDTPPPPQTTIRRGSTQAGEPDVSSQISLPTGVRLAPGVGNASTRASRRNLAPGVGNASIQAGGPQVDNQIGGALEQMAAAEQEAIDETIDEREEIFEESGGSSESTEELGDDANEEIQVLKKSLEVLYSFNPTYTADEFLESLSPNFVKLTVRRNASPQERERIREIKQDTRNAGAESILLARTTLKAGKARLKDYKALTNIGEPSLNLNQRRLRYKPKEFRKLQKILSSQPYPIEKLTEGISSFLDAPQFERVEGPMIVNKFEIENQFRLSPIEDAPVSVQSDTRTPPVIGSYLQQLSPDRSTFAGVRRDDDAFRSAERPSTGGGGPTALPRGDIDTGLIRDLDRDRQFRQQDFGAASDLEFDELETGGPPVGGNYGGGPRGY
jgi:hypothetical protein